MGSALMVWLRERGEKRRRDILVALGLLVGA